MSESANVDSEKRNCAKEKEQRRGAKRSRESSGCKRFVSCIPVEYTGTWSIEGEY